MYGLKVIYCVHFSRQLILQLFEISSLTLSCFVWGRQSSADRSQSVLGRTAVYDRMTSTKSLSTFSASLTNTCGPLTSVTWLQMLRKQHLHRPDYRNTLIYAHTPDSGHKTRLANVTCARRWRLCGITPDMTAYQSTWRNFPDDLSFIVSPVFRYEGNVTLYTLCL
jgi:hypothetical protein